MSDKTTNKCRAQWALAALNTFAAQTNMDQAGEEPAAILGDLLGNFMHLCSQTNLDFSTLLNEGRQLFTAEIAEAGENLPEWCLSFATGGCTATMEQGSKDLAATNEASAGLNNREAQVDADAGATATTPETKAKEIVVRVDPDYVPEEGDAFEAVQAALEFFSIPTTLVERDVPPPVRMVIGLDGGVIQGATANVAVEFLVFDYDLDGAEDHEITTRPALDGGEVDVFKNPSWAAEVDAPRITEIFDAVALETYGNTCEDCGAEVDSLVGSPDGAEVCQSCFDQGNH